MADQTDWVELRKNWRPRWLASIQEFADIKTQREKWLDPSNTNPHWSYIEYMCCYFDDLGLSDDLGLDGCVQNELLTAQEADATREFHVVAGAHNSPNDDDYDNAAVLADPKWLQVVEAAREAQRRLAALLTDPKELKLVLEP